MSGESGIDFEMERLIKLTISSSKEECQSPEQIKSWAHEHYYLNLIIFLSWIALLVIVVVLFFTWLKSTVKQMERERQPQIQMKVQLSMDSQQDLDLKEATRPGDSLSLEAFCSCQTPPDSNHDQCPLDHSKICTQHFYGQNLSDHPESFKIYLANEVEAKYEHDDMPRPVIHI